MEGTAHLSKGPATAAEGAGLSSSVVWISPGAVGPRPVSLAEEEGKATELRAQLNKNVFKKKKKLSLLASLAYVISVALLLPGQVALLLDLQQLVGPEKTKRWPSSNSGDLRDHSQL